MAGGYGGGPAKLIYEPHLNFLGGELIAMDGTSQPLSIPGGTQIIEIYARGGDVQFSQGAVANANSYGFVAQDTGVKLGPMIRADIVSGWALHGSADTYAHILYWKQNVP